MKNNKYKGKTLYFIVKEKLRKAYQEKKMEVQERLSILIVGENMKVQKEHRTHYKNRNIMLR